MGESSSLIDAAGQSSEALVVACSMGNHAALGTLFTRFHDSVRQFLSRHVGSRNPDRDDLIQATFLEVMRAASRFRADATVQTWIFGIALNVVRHYRRSETRRQLLVSDIRRPAVVRHHDPEADAACSELSARVAAALAVLPDHLRTVFIMRELREIPGAEVARLLNLSDGMLRRRLRAAGKLLRKTLKAQPGWLPLGP